MHVVFRNQNELCRHRLIINFPLRVCSKNVYTVFHILLVFTFRLEHEPLEDVVIVRNDTTYG
jgi:hypothetical protein